MSLYTTCSLKTAARELTKYNLDLRGQQGQERKRPYAVNSICAFSRGITEI
jgi:hypothetical protein